MAVMVRNMKVVSHIVREPHICLRGLYIDQMTSLELPNLYCRFVESSAVQAHDHPVYMVPLRTH